MGLWPESSTLGLRRLRKRGPNPIRKQKNNTAPTDKPLRGPTGLYEYDGGRGEATTVKRSQGHCHVLHSLT